MKISLYRTLTASFLMLLTLSFTGYGSSVEDIIQIRPLSSFPKQIDEWIGKEGRFDQRVYDVLGVDDSFLCDYVAPDGRHVQLYIGFYQSQREGDLIHSPKNCMPGGGWDIIHTKLEEIFIPRMNPGKIKVIKLILQRGKDRQVVLYWFQSRGRFIASEYMQKIYLVWDAIFKNRTDGSFVRLIAPVTTVEAHTTEYMKTFAQKLIPILEEYLPAE